ncbi:MULTISPECIES: hypothetical protein [Legionella]|uniref:Transmembrane protein n=1 Tax=Legionella donaldsonii TaxID=45060 RepID=A0A378J526_9GAMM|nr:MULTISPECIES: hypothetical protein [Legionella]MCC5015945.1 hypothetical protein [Legionella sp. 31fI33]STX42368.1 transmembrane protein [Legionella donaldsonii]
MEPDRYEQNSKVFILGIVTLLLSLTLFALGFYVVPYLFWGWNYDIPAIVLNWHEWLKEYYEFSEAGASWIIFLIFIIPALICGYISHLASNHIDNKIHGIEPVKTDKQIEIKEEVKATLSFGFKIVLLIVLVLLALSLLQWLLTVP